MENISIAGVGVRVRVIVIVGYVLTGLGLGVPHGEYVHSRGDPPLGHAGLSVKALRSDITGPD